ncbi:hypothetical protein ACHAWF_013719 [Thalassiosira exigua]
MLRLRPTFAAGVRLVLALLVASASPVSVRSYVASPEGPNGGGGVDQVRSAAERAVVASAAADDLMDRFDGVEADLILTVGRTPDTAMRESSFRGSVPPSSSSSVGRFRGGRMTHLSLPHPRALARSLSSLVLDSFAAPEWASSGAKLGLTVGVRFTSRPASSDLLGPEGEGLLEGDEGTGEEEGAGGGGGGGAAAGRRRRRRPSSPAVRSVVPTNVPSFTGAGGVEAVAVTEGGYACRIQRVATGQRSFRFFLDFPEGARRNDVVLPAERIYFVISVPKRAQSPFGPRRRGPRPPRNVPRPRSLLVRFPSAENARR